VLPTDEDIFCGDCVVSLDPILFACSGCALPRSVAAGSPRCSGCQHRGFAFAGAHAGFAYGEALAAAIIRMKHCGRPDLANRLGRLLAPTLGRALVVNGATGNGDRRPLDLILPVPLHGRKLRRRGFNQALELAKAALTWTRRSWRSCASPTPAPFPFTVEPAVPIKLERSVLVRVRDTEELGRLSPAARAEQVAGAFAVSDARRIEGRRVLIVDDVMTTGATLNECAQVLLRGGAAAVTVAALARAV
jgi:predicted amidophosphoribosyltransferase